MTYFAGVDIGSTSIKIVIIDDNKEILAETTAPTGSHFHKNTSKAFEELLFQKKISHNNIGYIVSTGYGRKLFKDADESISEITANAAGARKIGEKTGSIRTIINIGGQDLKVIHLDQEGHVVNFAMNDKCAAGTGRFLEMTARNLEIEVDELGKCHLENDSIPLTINSTCTVFAESEIIGLLANGSSKSEIIAGIHYSIARRVARLARRGGLEGMVFFDGGPAMNKGLVQAMEDELMCDVQVPQAPQITTALGAALIAGDAFYETQGQRAHAA